MTSRELALVFLALIIGVCLGTLTTWLGFILAK